jgi:hypothetical protein
MITMGQVGGTCIPHPDYQPTDLVTVRDVYGHRHRVRAADLESDKVMLWRYNQYGQRIFNQIPRLHRANIAT